MIFLETSVFTRQITDVMDDDDYRELQCFLMDNPSVGDLIQHSGGIRKIRWTGSGRGKRGGTRIIYYWDAGDKILMLYIYPKNERTDLSQRQLSILRAIVETYKNEQP